MKRAWMSGLVLSIGLGLFTGCRGDGLADANGEPEDPATTAQAASALTGAEGLFGIAGSELEQSSAVGAPWSGAGEAYGVKAMFGYHGDLYVASGNQIWKRGAIGPGTGNDWSSVGQAVDAVAMAYHQGRIYMVADNKLWQRGGFGSGTDWVEVGDAYGVTAMASYQGHLYAISDDSIWQRGAIGPGTGNDWSYAGDAYGFTSMAAYGGHLYGISANTIWQRGALGPGSFSDWSIAGNANGVTILSSIVSCDAGLSAYDCPAGGIDLSGLTNVAFKHPAQQSSTSGAGTASLAVDGNVFSSSATAVEASPWWSVDLGFDRDVQAVGVSTDAANGVVELLDANGAVVATEPLSAFSTANGVRVISFPPVTARAVRVRASGASLHVSELQAFARIMPANLFPLSQHPATEGVCWKYTYGRGAGTPITACDPGQDKDGALCYPACAPGYYGVGPVCWESCPSGWTDTGAFCHLDGSIISADNSSCPWYDVCGLTLAPGCSRCPDGYANDGCTCRIDPQDFAKSSYGRGAGEPLHCTATQEEQAALCYTPCIPGYVGAGPVCWRECGGDHAVDCGLACATSVDACDQFITGATTAVWDLYMNFAGAVESFGETAEAVSLVRSAAGLPDSTIAVLKSAVVKELLGAVHDLPETVAESSAELVVGGVLSGQIDWTQLDPTGIAAVVIAFNQSICG